MDNDRLTDPGPDGGSGYDAALLDHWLAGRTRVDTRSRHALPQSLIVPHWAGIASIKWVGQIEVSATPLFSYGNTQAYRLFGPAYPPGGAFITTQPVRSAFELEWNAQLPANQEYLLTGRSWSGGRPIARTEISTDGGRRWHPAIPRDPGTPAAWQR